MKEIEQLVKRLRVAGHQLTVEIISRRINIKSSGRPTNQKEI